MKKIFMASLALTTFTISIALFQLSSCKKADAQTQTTYPIQGLYTGTYSVNAVPAQGNLFYSLVIYPDGTMSTKGKGGDVKIIILLEHGHYLITFFLELSLL